MSIKKNNNPFENLSALSREINDSKIEGVAGNKQYEGASEAGKEKIKKDIANNIESWKELVNNAIKAIKKENPAGLRKRIKFIKSRLDAVGEGIFYTKNVGETIRMARDVYSDEKAEEIIKLYVKGEEKILKVAEKRYEKRTKNLKHKLKNQQNSGRDSNNKKKGNKGDNGNGESNDDGENSEKSDHNLQLLKLRIVASGNRFANKRRDKIHEMKIKTLEGLKESKDYYEQRIVDFEEDFEGNVNKKGQEMSKLSRLIEDIHKRDLDAQYIDSLKNSYLQSLREILEAVNEEIENKTIDPNYVGFSDEQEQDGSADMNGKNVKKVDSDDLANLAGHKGDNEKSQVDAKTDNSRTSEPKKKNKKENISAQDLEKLDQEIKKKLTVWQKSNLRSINSLDKKDKSVLSKYIADKKIEITSLQSDWGKNGSYKSFIKKIEAIDPDKAMKVKNQFIMGKVDVLFAAQKLYDDKYDESIEQAQGDENRDNERKESAQNEVEDLNKQSKEVEQEINEMPESEKKTLFENMADLGYQTQKFRSQKMGEMMSWMSKLTSKNKNLHDYFNEYSNIYKEDEAKAKQAIETKGKDFKAKGMGIAKGAGNTMKYGRVVYDALDSFSARGLNPLRNFTAGAMFLARSSEAVKRTVINSEAIKEKTRIEDVEEAMAEAERIFNINLDENGTTSLSKDDLENLYKEQLPKDILARIDRGGGIKGAGFIQRIFRRDADIYANRILKKINKVENNKKSEEEKKIEKEKIMQKYSALLKDLDVMITHEGVVDNWAYVSRVVEKTGKGVATLLVAESAYRLANGVYNMHIFDQAWDKGGEYIDKIHEIIEKSPVKNILAPVSGPESSPVTLDEAPVVSEDDSGEVLGPIASAFKEKLSDSYLGNAESSSAVKVPLMNRELKLNEVGVPVVDTTEKAPDASVNLADVHDQGGILQEPPEVSVSKEQLEQATIQSGRGANSIEGVFIKQLVNNPKGFGFQGDSDDVGAVRQWAGRQAHIIAMDNGYFDKDSGQGIRMKASSIDHNAYVLKNTNSGIGVDEYVNGEFRELHRPGADFENGNIDGNEYIHGSSNINQVNNFDQASEKVDIQQQTEAVKTSNITRPSAEPFTPESSKISNIERQEVVSKPANAEIIERSGGIHHLTTRERNELEYSRQKRFVGYGVDTNNLYKKGFEGYGIKIPPNDNMKSLGEQKDIFKSYESQFGITQDNLRNVGIDIRDGFSELENEKITYLIDHHGDLDKSVEVINIAEKLNVDYDSVQEYYYQLKDLEGNAVRQSGVLDILQGKTNYRQSMSKIFGMQAEQGSVQVNNKGDYIIKNFKPGFDIVAHISGGEMKFGVKGPLGNNWGANGRSLVFKPNATLTNKNIEKALTSINRLTKDREQK